MGTYYFFIWLLLMWMLEETFYVCQKEMVVGSQRIRVKPLFAFVAFAPLFFQAAFRGDVGDTYAYKQMYMDLPGSLSGLLSRMPNVTKDPGFTFFSGIIRILFGPDPTAYLVIIALLQSLVLVLFFRKYSCNYLIALFLFYASGDFFSWMTNGIRQFTAVIIILAGTKFVLKKDWIKIILTVLLASLFHQSALLMLVLIPIAQGSAWNHKSLIFVFVMLVSVLFVDQFTEILDFAMSETQYSSMVSDWNAWGDDGTNMFRVLVYSVPALISLAGLKRIRYIDDPIINYSVNLSIMTGGIYLLSMVTSGIFIGRLPIYISLYNYVLLPWELRHLFTKTSKRILYIVMIVLYLAFFTVQVNIG